MEYPRIEELRAELKPLLQPSRLFGFDAPNERCNHFFHGIGNNGCGWLRDVEKRQGYLQIDESGFKTSTLARKHGLRQLTRPHG